MGETDSGAKRLVKHYVKPDVLFCVALKVCAGHHLFGYVGAKLLKIYEVCSSLDINLNLFATNFPHVNCIFLFNKNLQKQIEI